LYLQLGNREASASADLDVVSVRGATNNGSQQASNRARSDGGRLRLARQATGLLPARLRPIQTQGKARMRHTSRGRAHLREIHLVEPRLHAALPVLVEVRVRDNVVVLGHAAHNQTYRQELSQIIPLSQTN
jgi:hypothetical protein